MLFIVSRDNPALYEVLRREFEGEPEVEVILDRRYGDRRRAATPVAIERRRGERRGHPEVEERLRSLGWAIVHRPRRSATIRDSTVPDPAAAAGEAAAR